MNTPSVNQYGCYICKYKCHKPANLKSHLQTKKHLRAIRLSHYCKPSTGNTPSHSLVPHSELVENSTTNNHVQMFSCEPCGFSAIKRADYNRHIVTQKHNAIISRQQQPSHQPNTHTQQIESKIETLSDAVLEIVKQNTEFQRIIIETQKQTQKQCTELLESCKSVCASASSTIIHNTTTNNHFNLQFFLNVTCKDAINISDFISGLNILPEHIERFGKIGFVDGITRILMDGLNSLEKHKRPIHCTDLKRDTMYIRESDQWQKDVENTRLSQAIESVEQYNCRAFCKGIAPPSMKNETELMHYMTVLREVNGGYSREKNRAKIVKNISKACFVVRSNDNNL